MVKEINLRRLLVSGLAAVVFAGCGHNPSPASKSDEAKAKTKIEAFESQTGVAIVRGFTTVGKLEPDLGSGVSVDCWELTNANTGKKEAGISVDVGEHTSYIDYDEISDLIKGIQYLGRVDKSSTKLQEFQADFKTKGDLQVSTFSSPEGIQFSVTSGSVGHSNAYFKLAKLSDFEHLIETAKATLDAAK